MNLNKRKRECQVYLSLLSQSILRDMKLANLFRVDIINEEWEIEIDCIATR